MSLSFRQVDAISPTPLRGNPGCGGEDAYEGTEGQVAALARGLAGTDDLTETQGDRWLSLVERLKSLLKDGAVTDESAVDGLRDLLSRISAAMSTREDLEALASALSSAAWNAVMPPDKWV